MAAKVDGNAYVRARDADGPLVTWSPVAGRNCLAKYDSLEAFRKGAGVESRGVALPWQGMLFRSAELSRFELAHRPQGLQDVAVAPEALDVLGWRDAPHVPGAYPLATRDAPAP